MTIAIILAAGQGTRLRPLTESIPKCLLPVGEYPILHHQLTALRHKADAVVVVLGYKKELIRNYAEKHFPDVPFIFVENPLFEHTNTLYSLALAAEVVSSASIVIQLNGDVVFDASIIDLLLGTEGTKSYAALQLGKCAEEEIKVKLNKDASIMELNKKVDPLEAAGEAIGINKFCGVFWVSLREILDILKETARQEYFEYAMEKTIRKGGKIFALDTGDRRAIEIDFPEDLEKVRRLFSVT